MNAKLLFSLKSVNGNIKVIDIINIVQINFVCVLLINILLYTEQYHHNIGIHTDSRILSSLCLHTDPTLTLNNVIALMKDVQKWEHVAIWIGIPINKTLELLRQHPTTDQHKQAYWDYWLHHHPSPSWRILADTLYVCREHGALEVLQMNYLKGECSVACVLWYLYVP